MATKEQLKRAIKYAKSKGVKAIKIEFEAKVDPEGFPDVEGYACPNQSCHAGQAPLPCKVCRGSGENEDGEECENCDGSGESEDDDQCQECDGYAVVPCSDESLEGDYADAFGEKYKSILDAVLDDKGETFRDVVCFHRAMLDISAGTELTLTVPVEKAYLLEEFVTSFASACGEFGNNPASVEKATERAGMHMSLLWTNHYPTKECLDQRLRAFKSNVEKLRLALIYLGSVAGKTRSLDYRGIHNEARGCLDYHEDTCVEFRAFDPCYGQPGQILDDFLMMARTLYFFADKVGRPVRLSSGYWDLAPNWIGGPHHRWGWSSLEECFFSSGLRERLLQEVAHFASGPLATRRAKEAKKDIAGWRPCAPRRRRK